MKKKFSIIIPIYNCESFIERCVNSVLSQIKDSYEIFLIDDGSQDNSGKICDELANDNKNITVLHKKNEGVSAARNDALKMVKSEYVIFLDSDDYLSDGYFDEINNILNNNKNIELINFGFLSEVEDKSYNVVSSDLINYEENYYKNKKEIKKEFVKLWDNTMLYNIWNKVYLSKVIKDNNICFPKANWGEDVEFNKMYLDCIANMYNSQKCFYHYIRERQGAATKKYKTGFFEIRKNEFIEYNNYFESWKIKKDVYYEFSCRRFIERVLGCVENIYCSDMNFKTRYSEVRKIVLDSSVREALKYAQPKSIKIKFMLIPIKMKSILLTMLMGKMFNVIKTKFPALFNKLKNRR